MGTRGEFSSRVILLVCLKTNLMTPGKGVRDSVVPSDHFQFAANRYAQSDSAGFHVILRTSSAM